jgi:undecaprenyl-diphosphatase
VHALVLAGVLFVAGLVLTLVIKSDPVDPPVQGVDDGWLDLMVDVRTPFGIEVAKVISAFGNVYLLWPLRFLAGAILVWRRQWLQLTAFALAVFTSELFIGPLKAWVDRPRPPDPLVVTTSQAYPSGHAIAAAVTAFALVVVFVPVRPGGRLRFIGVAATAAALMALSRTYLSAHWLTDVVGGCLFGVSIALVWPASLELIRERYYERSLEPGPSGPTPDTVERTG